MPDKKETWREFERLAARIYKDLTPKDAIVNHNDKLMGRSGIERQIDVSIRYEIAGHAFMTVIQAKDFSTPADINTVGEFASVIEDVCANKGVLICRSGFTDGAIRRSSGANTLVRFESQRILQC